MNKSYLVGVYGGETNVYVCDLGFFSRVYHRGQIQNKSISQNMSPNFWYMVQKY